MEDLPPLQLARQFLKQIPMETGTWGHPLFTLALAVEQVLNHLEALSSTAAQKETPPSSPAIESTAASRNGSSISSPEFCLVRADRDGELRIMATVTFHEPSSMLTPGAAQNVLLAGAWMALTRAQWESLSQSGATRFETQVEPAVGPSAGGADAH